MSHAARLTSAAAGLALCAALVGNPASALAQSAPAAEGAAKSGATMWVTTTQRVKTRIYENAGLGPHPILIIVLHGDSPDGPPTYQYRFAERAAAAIPDAVVAAVLRPGYSDGEDRSDGMRGETTGDNYTPEVINAVATVLSELKTKYHPRRVILVGHSGGAAITGNLLSQQGVSADAALLVSCPCDLAAWRKHMQSIKGGRIWERPVRSLSPIEQVDGIPTSTKVSLLVGSDDQIAPAELTTAYADALRKRDVAVDVTIAPGLAHNILLEPIAMDRLKDVAGAPDAGR
jgi:predicted esterase